MNDIISGGQVPARAAAPRGDQRFTRPPAAQVLSAARTAPVDEFVAADTHHAEAVATIVQRLREQFASMDILVHPRVARIRRPVASPP